MTGSTYQTPIKTISAADPAGGQLSLWSAAAHQGKSRVQPPTIALSRGRLIPTEVYDTYWYFAAERQEVFYKKLTAVPPPLTADPILQRHKFTNAYRASDRVSQYLIQEVIYKGSQDPEEVFFRSILFKLFNKIETWETLSAHLGPISWAGYNFDAYARVLDDVRSGGNTIYSGAYIMASGKSIFGYERKHKNHLRLLERLMQERVPARIAAAESMEEAFLLLRSYPCLGDFLAYQYVTDLNYSCLTDFPEDTFVVPGPGAKDGIRKCFSDIGGYSDADIIRIVWERQAEEFDHRGISFRSLWGRPLQLIDCQNLFCEVDKYARVAHPEVAGISGRSRIKQKYNPVRKPLKVWYPPKWGINEQIPADLRARP